MFLTWPAPPAPGRLEEAWPTPPGAAYARRSGKAAGDGAGPWSGVQLEEASGLGARDPPPVLEGGSEPLDPPGRSQPVPAPPGPPRDHEGGHAGGVRRGALRKKARDGEAPERWIEDVERHLRAAVEFFGADAPLASLRPRTPEGGLTTSGTGATAAGAS